MRNQLIKTLNGMGTGLLATLVVGTILIQMGTLFNVSFLKQLGEFAKVLMAPAIGVGVGVALQAKPLILFFMFSHSGHWSGSHPIRISIGKWF